MSWMPPCSPAWARSSRSRRGRCAPGAQRSQGSADRPRGAGEEPHGGEEQGKNLTLPILKRQNGEQPGRSNVDGSIESEIMALIKVDPQLARRFDILVSSRRPASPPRAHHRHARTRQHRQRPGRFPGRPRARRTAVRTLDRPRLHTRRPVQCPAGPLCARLVAMRFNPDLKAKYASSSRENRRGRSQLCESCRETLEMAKWSP